MSNERWTPDAIIQRITKWHTRYGEAPKVADWKHSGADEDGSYPSEATVKGKFGSWSVATGSAGFEPRTVGRPANATAGNGNVGVAWSGQSESLNTGGAGYNQWPYQGQYQQYPYWNYTWDTGARKKLDALKAVIEQGTLERDVLLAIINA